MTREYENTRIEIKNYEEIKKLEDSDIYAA